jgi:hypothetical protein
MDPQEALYRLADAADIVASVELDADGVELQDPQQAGAILSALDYALRGDPGCSDPDEWQARREAALERYHATA